MVRVASQSHNSTVAGRFGVPLAEGREYALNCVWLRARARYNCRPLVPALLQVEKAVRARRGRSE